MNLFDDGKEQNIRWREAVNRYADIKQEQLFHADENHTESEGRECLD